MTGLHVNGNYKCVGLVVYSTMTHMHEFTYFSLFSVLTFSEQHEKISNVYALTIEVVFKRTMQTNIACSEHKHLF